ncbi:MAG: response regulator [Bryobacteraceae bacterium]|nr:response regulator [Bryobacteraceae bacterium]
MTTIERLPLAGDAFPRGETFAPLPSGPPIRILLIEDSEEHAHWVKNLLSSRMAERLQLTWAASVTEASSRLRRANLDLVLLDLGLPDLSGYRTHRAVRLLAPELPIVILTSNDGTLSRDMALLNGVVEYLVKSDLTSEQLCSAIWRAYSSTNGVMPGAPHPLRKGRIRRRGGDEANATSA